MPITTGELQYKNILKILTPCINSGDFKVLNSTSDKYGQKGIVEGKFTWDVENSKLSVYAGFTKDENLIIVPSENRLQENQLLFLVQKTFNKPYKIKKYIQIMEYFGKTSIDLGLGSVTVHNYYVRLPQHEEKSKWNKTRDIIEVTNEKLLTFSGMYKASEEAKNTIMNMFPNLNKE